MSSVKESLNIKFHYTLRQRQLIGEGVISQLKTIPSKFNRDKLFVAYSTPYGGYHNPYVKLLLLTNLKVLGMMTVSVNVSCPSLKINEEDLENVSDADEFSTGGLQLFVTPEIECTSALLMLSKFHTFYFSIFATSCVCDYKIKMMDSLLKRQLWLNRVQLQHSDIALIVNNRPYPCHKAILAACSSFFLNKFITDPNLKQVNIEVDPLTTDADVEQFLEFVYTGQFAIKPLIRKQLLQLAKTFEIKTLIELCDYTQQEMTMTQLMNLAVLIEPYHDPAGSQTSEFIKEDSEDWYVFSYRPAR
jgi:hypothetical protein